MKKEKARQINVVFSRPLFGASGQSSNTAGELPNVSAFSQVNYPLALPSGDLSIYNKDKVVGCSTQPGIARLPMVFLPNTPMMVRRIRSRIDVQAKSAAAEKRWST